MNRDSQNVKTEASSTIKSAILLTTLFIGLNFFWTGSAYLSWANHMAAVLPVSATYMASEVWGPVAQMAGLFLFAWLLKRDAKSILYGKLIYVVMVLDGCSILPVVFSEEAAAVLLWGIIMNLFHGFIAGYYITVLAERIPAKHRGFCFGIGYALGSLGSYLLSLIGETDFLGTSQVWFVLAFLIVLSGVLTACMNRADCFDNSAGENASLLKELPPLQFRENRALTSSLLLAGAVVILLSLTTQLLFYSSAQVYLENTVILNFSHMFYAVGLVIAAVVNDKSRKAGLILALLSLCFPLLSLSLYHLSNIVTILAIIGYVATGFFAVYRIVAFTDLYEIDGRLLSLAPAGLFFGRLGEATGAAAGQIIGSRHVLLTVITALLFTASIILAFPLYIRLYGTKPAAPAETAEERAKRFYEQYNLSLREQQVFLLLTEGKTNPEIAQALFISENTVKFHVKNLLRKTDCQKRTDMVRKFRG